MSQHFKTAIVIIVSVVIAKVLYREYDAYRIRSSFNQAVQQMEAESAAEEKRAEERNENAQKQWEKMIDEGNHPGFLPQNRMQ